MDTANMKQGKIKIIATVGPSSYNKSIINKMDLAGVDIFRVNLSHTCIDDLEEIINQLREWTEKTICIDTEGAQIRTGTISDNSVKVDAHEIVELVDAGTIGDKSRIPLTLEEPWNILRSGSVLKIDFNTVILQVVKVEGEEITGRILEGGIIRSNKGISHDIDVHLPAFTSKDVQAFKIAKKYGINTVAFSFASSARDVVVLRGYFDGYVTVISKIESALGLSNVDAITYCKPHEYDLLVSTFAHDHIHYDERFAFAKNLFHNMKKGGRYIIGMEILPHFSTENDRKKALFKYHNYIIEMSLQDDRVQLSELENNALKSGLDMVGDFKRHEVMFEEELMSAGFKMIARKKVGPLDRGDVGGVYVYAFEA